MNRRRMTRGCPEQWQSSDRLDPVMKPIPESSQLIQCSFPELANFTPHVALYRMSVSISSTISSIGCSLKNLDLDFGFAEDDAYSDEEDSDDEVTSSIPIPMKVKETHELLFNGPSSLSRELHAM